MHIAAGATARYDLGDRLCGLFRRHLEMSFFGEATASSLDVVARNMPMWRDGIRWPK
ncbi:hypothetical protein NKH98_30085 [Mesorhizobium sp. M0833]|uniref:hypothetical protein n=1 Tax=unclassified Mesorhizobium TaxID=325217 RepID=UPI00333BF84D